MKVQYTAKLTFGMREVLSVAHDPMQNWLAVGGFMGELLCMRMEEGRNLPMDATEDEHLTGHRGDVLHIVWNPSHERMTTADENGMIIVWKLDDGVWIQDMINQREKCGVASLRWNASGSRIAIGYTDGSVLVGSVEGEKVWSIDFHMGITSLCWEPEGNFIFFGTDDGSIRIYESKGKFYSDMNVVAIEGEPPSIEATEWAFTFPEEDPNNVPPDLCIATGDGVIQLFRGMHDERPLLIDTGFQITKIRWGPTHILCVLGYRARKEKKGGSEKRSYEVHFYTAFGELLRALKVPGVASANDISWDGPEAVSIASGQNILYVAVLPERHYAYTDETLAYVREEENAGSVVFWNMETNERHVCVKNIVGICASSGNFLCISRREKEDGYYLEIVDSIGVPIKKTSFSKEPVSFAMHKGAVVVCSHTLFMIWKIGTVSPVRSVNDLVSDGSRAYKFRITDFPASSEITERTSMLSNMSEAFEDYFTSTSVGEKIVVVGRRSGSLCFVSLRRATISAIHETKIEPAKISLNFAGTGLSLLDKRGTMWLYSLSITEDGEITCTREDFERADVWDMMWSDDKDDLFVVCDANGIYIYLGGKPEEPLTCTGYLCRFRDLVVKVANIDEIINSGSNLSLKRENLISAESRLVSDTRELIKSVGLEQAFSFVNEREHPRLWHIISEEALESLDVAMAEKAFVKCSDYRGIQFVKRLKVLDNVDLQKAEVCIHFNRFDRAQEIYENIGRIDLALEMREKIGDWFPVMRLATEHHLGQEVLKKANHNIGLYYMRHNKYGMAAQRFEEAGSAKELLDCLLHLEDYEMIQELAQALPKGSALLMDIGNIFARVGISDWAAEAFTRTGDIELAIETCVQLCDWDRAVALANEFEYEGIHSVLSKYAEHLISLDRQFDAIDLHRIASRYLDAARLIIKMAHETLQINAVSRAGRLYVAAGLLVRLEEERHASSPRGVKEDFSDRIDGRRVWRCAEVCHFHSIALNMMWARRFEEAFRYATPLADYCDVFNPQQIYSALAFISFQNEDYELTSLAMSRLETMQGIPSEDRRCFRELSVKVFKQHPVEHHSTPDDGEEVKRVICGSCERTKLLPWTVECNTCGARQFCVSSGVRLDSSNYGKKCKTCGNCVSKKSIQLRFCPVCHQKYTK